MSLPALSSQRLQLPLNADKDLNFEGAERAHILRALSDTNWIIGGPRGAASNVGA